MSAEIEQLINETLISIKNYIDATSISSLQNSNIEKPPETIIENDVSNNDECIQFSLSSVAGLMETLLSMQKEISYLRQTLGI